mmetsp:Transcript_2433/g.7270  ORF Transcript_2433/g.7270 Transcript_2433/m.7270 type:complete len:384 (-) Transcript_2433:1609-2760(-)
MLRRLAIWGRGWTGGARRSSTLVLENAQGVCRELVPESFPASSKDVLKDDSVRTLLAKGDEVFARRRDLVKILDGRRSVVLRDKATGKASAVCAYHVEDSPLLGASHSDSLVVKHLHRSFTVGEDSECTLALARLQLSDCARDKVVETGFIAEDQVPLYENAGYLCPASVEAVYCSKAPQQIRPLREQNVTAIKLESNKDLQRAKRKLTYAHEGLRFAHWNARKNCIYALVDESGRWLAVCEALRTRIKFSDLPFTVRAALLPKFSQAFLGVLFGSSIELEAAIVGAVANPSSADNVAILFQHVNKLENTDVCIHYMDARNSLLHELQELNAFSERMGIGGLALSTFLNGSHGKTVFRTHNMNSLHRHSIWNSIIAVPADAAL